MVAETIARMVFLTILLIDLWGVFAGVVVVRHLRRSRKLADVIGGAFRATVAMTLNAAAWALLMATLLSFPLEQDFEYNDRNGFILVLFTIASVTITWALTDLWFTLTSPRKPRLPDGPQR